MSRGGNKMEQTRQNVSPMSNEGRNAYVIEHLTQALSGLLTKKPLSDISISELCDTAGVGRTSFYRNFENKEDIVRSHIKELFGTMIKENPDKEGQPLSSALKILFTHFETHREFYALLNKRGLIYLLKDVIIGIFGPKSEHGMFEAYTKAYVAYSLYGWIEVWFQRGMRESAEELAGLFQGAGL